MVEIIYGEHSQQADLAGKSVDQVRELYRDTFEIPDDATAKLNGKRVKKNLESEATLFDSDSLLFQVESRKAMILLAAFLLTLSITSGLFAYTLTTDSTTITVVGVGNDFASVSSNNSVVYNTTSITGKTVGKINAGVMFDVTKDSIYSGDLEVVVSIANADELVQEYSFWMLRVKFTDGTVSNGVDTTNSTQVISLKNPTASFAVDSVNLSVTRHIHVLGGSYKTLSASQWAGQAYDPVVFAQVVQAGAH
ncbi:hypothetical protein ACFLWL_00175 [Chloroflexota bacterium]